MKVNFENTINKPIEAVYEAIVNHEKMSCYFISGSDSNLIANKTVHWEFSDVGSKIDINVKKIKKNKLIQFEWATTGKPTMVEITLDKIDNANTKIKITEGEWDDNEDITAKVLQQSIGWTDFFCSLKAYLLFNVNLRKGKSLDDNSQIKKENAVQFLEMAMNRKEPKKAVKKYIAKKFIQHNPSIADGKQALSDNLESLINEFPNEKWDLKRVIAEDDIVVLHGHRKLSPDDKGASVVNIFRFDNEKICEQWTVNQLITDVSKNENTMF